MLIVLLCSRPSSSVLSRLQAVDDRDVPVMWPCGSVQGPGQSNGGEGIECLMAEGVIAEGHVTEGYG